MKRLFAAIFILGALLGAAILHGAPPEKQKVVIAVGGKASLYYLPLTIAEQLGYFRDATGGPVPVA